MRVEKQPGLLRLTAEEGDKQLTVGGQPYHKILLSRLGALQERLDATEKELSIAKQELTAHKARLEAVERKLGGKVV